MKPLAVLLALVAGTLLVLGLHEGLNRSVTHARAPVRRNPQSSEASGPEAATALPGTRGGANEDEPWSESTEGRGPGRRRPIHRLAGEPLLVPGPAAPPPRAAASPGDAPPEGAAALEARASSGPTPTWSRQQSWDESKNRTLEQLIDDLRDDDTKWNATHATQALSSHIRESASDRQRLKELLPPHLASPDQQLRVLTTLVLMELGTACDELGEPFQAPPRLLDSTVRWLDEPPTLETFFYHLYRPNLLLEFAQRHADQLEGRLLVALRKPLPGRDPFWPAYLLAVGGGAEHTDLVAPHLLPHLRDNWTNQDACLAQYALAALGPSVLPHLDAALPEADEQQQLGIEAIRFQILAPCLDDEDAAGRLEYNSVTTRVNFPPAQFDLQYYTWF